MSEQTKTLTEALVALQTNLPRITKSETANAGNYTYTYADLADVSAQILPALAEVGLAFTARPTVQENGQFVLAYSLVHTSGEREDGSYPLPSSGSPQAVGSAITYARRYCLLAVTGAAPEEEDDDARAAMHTRTGPGEPSAEEKQFAAQVTRQVDVASDATELNRIWAQVTSAVDNGLTGRTATELKDRMKSRAQQIKQNEEAA